MRYLAIDWGSVRVGAAVSDPDGQFAFPLDRVIDNSRSIPEIQKIVEELGVGVILVGLPKNLSGQDTASTELTKKFITKLQNMVTVPIELLDERFSSVAAGKKLAEQGISEKNQRGMKDNMAAQIMLQQYLDTKTNN